MIRDLLGLSVENVAVIMLVLFLIALAFRCGWGIGAWLAGRLK